VTKKMKFQTRPIGASIKYLGFTNDRLYFLYKHCVSQLILYISARSVTAENPVDGR